MFKNVKPIVRWVVTVLMVGMLCPTIAQAKKPPPPDEEPTAAELNPAIAFVATDKRGQSDIIVAAADLNSEVVLTRDFQWTDTGQFGSPAWSPDGTLVAFWAQPKIDGIPQPMRLYVATADGSQVTLVREFNQPFDPAPDFASHRMSWSPTGVEIVYAVRAAGMICAIDVVTGNVRVLLHDTSAWLGGAGLDDPMLSVDLDPITDGYQGMIAIGARDGSANGTGELFFDVFAAPLDTDELGYLQPIDLDAFVNLTGAPGTTQRYPCWSPDGTQIACIDTDWLAVLDVMTGQVTPLSPYGTEDNRVTWTSDGGCLVYQAGSSGRNDTDLAIIAADGGGTLVNYTATRRRRERSPAWNPAWDPFGVGGF